MRLPGWWRDADRSHGDPHEPNLLMHGDNLTGMVALAGPFSGRVRCIYMDPPYNTGREFVEYTDQLAPSEWREMMRARVAAAVPLLSADGTLAVQIDDNELAGALSVLDEALGAGNRISIVTLVRSAATGHKARNRGPVNVSDFILLYARDRALWRATAQWTERRGHDAAYSTFVENAEAAPEEWRFVPLKQRAAQELGHASTRAATRALGAETFAARVERFALSRCDAVVRFAQPRYEAVSHAARAAIDRSKGEPDRVFVLARPGHSPMLLRGGNRILFLKDKVRERDGRRVLVEPLTNVWTDVPFQGIAREGGVAFTRNKKPERLLARLLAMTTEQGDWVLDPFLGSGTTSAVAHKMGRRWIGIERGGHVDSLCIPRLTRVVDGADPTGITSATGWTGGGGFAVLRETAAAESARPRRRRSPPSCPR